MTLRHRQSRILDLVVTRSAASQATLNEIEENILILGRDHYIFDELWWEGVGRGAMGKIEQVFFTIQVLYFIIPTPPTRKQRSCTI